MAGQNAYIKERTEAGFLCCYNHPYWSLQNYDDYKDFEGLWAMEIYNHGCEHDGLYGFNPQSYDEMLRSGQKLFTVATDDLRVRVLGTAFCVQAYENSGQAEVVLEHGSVRLQTPEGVNLVTLQPDQRALYDAAADNLEISHVNASHLVLSQYDLVTMANATLHEIISHIETTYGVRISVPGRYGDKRYAFNYQRSNSLEEVLNIVEYMTGEHCEVIFRQK